MATLTLSQSGTTLRQVTTAPFSFQATFTIPPDAANGTEFVLLAEAIDTSNNLASKSLTVKVTTSQLSLSVVPPVSPTFQSSQVLKGSIDGAAGGAAITITGGASAVSQRLPTNQSQFGLNVPLKPNAENSLSVTATDDSGRTASAYNLNVVQLTLSNLVTAQVTARRLSTPEVQELVANGTISISNPANFNVSMFAIALTVGGHSVGFSVPGVGSSDEPFELGPEITISCQDKGKDIEQSGNDLLVPCDDDGTGRLPKIEPIKLRLFDLDLDGPDGPVSIPGAIVIEGKIKTLKEFFKVNLLLMNVSSGFTLSNITAKISVPDNGLSPVAPASAVVAMDDLGPGAQGTGQFVIRGDNIGVHTVTVNFGAMLKGTILSIPVPISGSASTDIEVKGPPTLDVTVEHPDSVTAGQPYTLTVNIKNTSKDLDALFTSLEFDAGRAEIIDATTGLPSIGPDIASLGDILAGQSVSRSFTVVSGDTGPIISCVAGATTNIKLSVVFTDSDTGCTVGTLPSQTVSASGQPTVTVSPAANTTNVPLTGTIAAFFSRAMQTLTITATGSAATFRVIDPNGGTVAGALGFLTLPNGATVATLLPNSPLRPNTTYKVIISPNIFDVSGNKLASGLTTSFSTEMPANSDTVSPRITIQVLPPANPQAVPQGQILRVSVDSSDNSGAVARIDLLLDGQLVDARVPISTATFLVDTSSLDPGSSHVLTAIATDAAGNTAQTAINIAITPDIVPPTVGVTVASTVQRGQTLAVSIQAADDTRVARVDVFIDSGVVPVYTGFVAPYQFGLDTTSLGNGPHQLRAQATDGAGNVAQGTAGFSVRSLVSIAISPPIVALVGTGTVQSLAITGTFNDGSTALIQSGVTLLSLNTAVATVSPLGVVTSVAPGSTSITATTGSLTPAVVSVTDVASTPTSLTLVSGDSQTGVAGQALSNPFIVKVTDANNQPVPNVPVTFLVLAGGGSPTSSVVATNNQGLASLTLTLGPATGANTVTAAVASVVGSPATFNANGKAPNHAPLLANPGSQSSVESSSVSLSLTASDPDGDALMYSAAGLPASLSINSATGVISGTIAATAGIYPVTTTVSDGNLSTSQIFTWTVTAPSVPFVDLGVSLTNAPNPISTGAELTYSVLASNLGTANADNVVITDALPTGVTFLRASPGCTNNSGSVTCIVGTLTANQSATINIVAAAFAKGQIRNTVTVSTTQIDTAPSNNSATAVATVVAAPFTAPALSATTITELFDTNNLNWSPTGAMSTPRAGTTLTVLADRTVLVLGGVSSSADPSSAVSSGELFNPETGTWSPSTPLTVPRAFHTATLLPNGDVLITGGVDASGNPVTTTEIYRSPLAQKITPVVTWNTPAPISLGTPLGSAQLNATANVPGSFNYTPLSGTILAPGLQTLSVTFLPNDTVHYTTGTSSVTVTVTP